MSSRGRGYGGYNSRGSRGGGFRGSYRGGGSRGSYEGRGGRGGGGYSSYNDSSRYGGGGSRYHHERRDDSYKKPFRPENSYSSREYGGRSGSPERKRMRMEGSSERRSHDGGGHYYGGRQDGYSGERRAYNGEGRRSSASRDGYRKGSEMASGGRSPPRSAPPLRSRVMRAPRRSLRGRPMRTRGYFRGSSRSRPYAVRRYTDRAPMPYTRVYRSLKGRSLTTRAKEDEASSTDGEWDTEDKEPEVEEKKEPKIKSPKEVKVSEEAEVEAAVAAADEAEETEKEGDAASDEGEPAPPFVNLTCVHCKEKYATFSGYTKHLLSSKHRTAMAVVARKHKAVLLRMRVAQRDAQRELEIAGGAKLAPRTAFCPVCRLNHRTTRHAHNLSDTHRAMKRFLTPFCRICRLAFRSPMMYEHHIASIEHLKCKSRQPAHVPSPKADGEEASGDEGMDVDLDNFMTLDSVGDVDEVDDEDSGGEKKEGDEEVKKPKVEINIGSEHVKKIEVYWCELCRVYVGRESPAAVGPAVGPAAAVGQAAGAEALRRHCRLRAHLRRYVQHRDTRTLRKHAERIHRQLHQAKDGGENNEMKVDANADIPKTEKVDETEEKKNVNGTEVALTGNEDKLWADVDKDIGDLLREVDPQVNDGSDDDDDLDRYDKFRKSDKLTDAEDNQPVVAESNVEKKATELNASA